MFDDIKREMEKTNSILDILYSNLGLCAFENNVNRDDSLFSQIGAVYAEKKKLDEAIGRLNEAQKTLQSSDSRRLSSELESLLCSLGAICSEIDKNGQIPEALKHCMSALNDFDSKSSALSEKANRKALFNGFWKNRLEKHSENQKKAFFLTGKAVINSGKEELLPSVKAVEIVNNIHDIKIRLSKSRKVTAKARESIKEVSKDTELSSKSESRSSELDSLCLVYGKALAANLEDLKSNPSLEKICSKIEKEQKHLVRLNMNMENIEVENELIVHEKLATQYQEQLEYLNKKVKEVSDKLEVENQAISILKAKNKGQD